MINWEEKFFVWSYNFEIGKKSGKISFPKQKIFWTIYRVQLIHFIFPNCCHALHQKIITCPISLYQLYVQYMHKISVWFFWVEVKKIFIEFQTRSQNTGNTSSFIHLNHLMKNIGNFYSTNSSVREFSFDVFVWKVFFMTYGIWHLNKVTSQHSVAGPLQTKSMKFFLRESFNPTAPPRNCSKEVGAFRYLHVWRRAKI